MIKLAIIFIVGLLLGYGIGYILNPIANQNCIDTLKLCIEQQDDLVDKYNADCNNKIDIEHYYNTTGGTNWTLAIS